MRDVNATIVLSDIRTMTDRVSLSVARTRFAMILLVTFAGVALALAVVGIYGVISYSVSTRAHEIGVRVALGAAPDRIVAQFVTDGMKLALAGIGAGIVGATFFTRFQSSLLYGITASDPATYAAVSALFCVVALLATYLPARRASKIHPMELLRDD